MSETKHTYAQGMYFNPNHPNTPDSVKEWKKGGVAIQRDKFVEQLKSLEVDDKGYVRFDLTKNQKDGETFYSFRLNTYKPEKKEDINPQDIPF